MPAHCMSTHPCVQTENSLIDPTIVCANAQHPSPPPLTHSPTHSLTHPLTHPPTHSGIKINDQFRHPLTGDALPVTSIYVDETDAGYPHKVVRKLITPRVTQLAREQFGCPTLTGVPLEDSAMVIICRNYAYELRVYVTSMSYQYK